MTNPARISRTDTYDHTLAGLLSKREELLRETQECRERMAILANDVDAIDRVLDTFGYRGELNGGTPRQARIVLFYRNELREYLLSELRKAEGPLSLRQLACLVCQCEGKDYQDRRLLTDMTRRVGSCLRKMRATKVVDNARGKDGSAVWTIRPYYVPS